MDAIEASIRPSSVAYAQGFGSSLASSAWSFAKTAVNAVAGAVGDYAGAAYYFATQPSVALSGFTYAWDATYTQPISNDMLLRANLDANSNPSALTLAGYGLQSLTGASTTGQALVGSTFSGQLSTEGLFDGGQRTQDFLFGASQLAGTLAAVGTVLPSVKVPSFSTTTASAPVGNQLNIIEPNFTPNQAALNKVTAFDFYTEQASFTPIVALQHMRGIDFNAPVDVVTIPRGSIANQFSLNGQQGNYYGSTTIFAPESLGVTSQNRIGGVWQAMDDIPALRSTAAPIYDTWSAPGQTFPTTGGAVQYFVPPTSNPAFVPLNSLTWP